MQWLLVNERIGKAPAERHDVPSVPLGSAGSNHGAKLKLAGFGENFE
jgi:hypothetical protein